MNSKKFLLALTASLALTGAGRGALYKCQTADGHVVLRDRHCRVGENVVEEVRSSDVPRRFTMMNTAPADAERKKTAPTATSAAKP
jgi:hypothetical protein